MQSAAQSPEEYLAQLPEDRRAAISTLRETIRKNLGKGFAEGMQYGMIGYFVPHTKYPKGYHCDPRQPLPFASIASQKNHLAFYSFFLYQNPEELERFQKEWKAAGKKLDMGKACVRFKKIEDVPLDVIAGAIKRQKVAEYIASYESHFGEGASRPASQKKAAAKKTTPKTAAATKTKAAKAPVKKAAAKKAVSKKPAAKKAPTKKA
ncbi:MAG: DUF1801 domain-containing protein [Planctomycetota bacterium]